MNKRRLHLVVFYPTLYYKVTVFCILQGIVVILEDNYPGDMSGYLLGVYTGSRIDSSTDANVGIKLLGENGESRVKFITLYY